MNNSVPTSPSSSEFRKHKDITNPAYIMGFLAQWKMYLDQLPAGADAHTYRGKKLDPTIYEKVNDNAFVVKTDVRRDALF